MTPLRERSAAGLTAGTVPTMAIPGLDLRAASRAACEAVLQAIKMALGEYASTRPETRRRTESLTSSRGLVP